MKLSLERIRHTAAAGLLMASVSSISACDKVKEEVRAKFIDAMEALARPPKTKTRCISPWDGKNLSVHEPIETYSELINKCQNLHEKGYGDRQVYCIDTGLLKRSYDSMLMELANKTTCKEILHNSENNNAAFNPDLKERACYLARPICK